MINEKLAQIMQNTTSVFNSNNTSRTENYTSSNIFEESNRKSSYTDDNDSSIFNLFDTDNKTASTTLCSAVGAYGDIVGTVIDAIDGESKDGKISNTKQGYTGDCWVLSAINSLNSTQKGKELLKEALQYGDYGTFVNFKGGIQVYVSDAEVTRTKGSIQYSSGDDDMIILELAVEKIMDKIANDEIIFSDDMPLKTQPTNREIHETGWFYSSIGDGGYEPFVMYLLSGKESSYVYAKGDEKEEILDKFINSEKTFVDGEYLNKDFVMGAGVSETTKVKDINGKNVELHGPHAYSVKSATSDTVTVVNPWDSSEEITLSRDLFLSAFDTIHFSDLSDEAKDANYLISTTKETVENSDGTKTEYIKDSNTGDILIIKEIEYYENGKIKKETRKYQNGLDKSETNYGKNGKFQSSSRYYYNENGSYKTVLEDTYEKGKLKTREYKYYTYYENGDIECASYDIYVYDKNRKIQSSSTYSYNENGNVECASYDIYDKNGKIQISSRSYYNENGSYKYTMEDTYEKGKVTRECKYYDENGKYDSGRLITYKDGEAVSRQKDTNGDGIYDTVE